VSNGGRNTNRTLKPAERLPANCGFCGKRFRSGIKAHEKACGKGLPDRYRILAITGYGIKPNTSSKSNDPPGTTYTVHDSADQWLEVGWFDSLGRGDEIARRKAEILCRKLNREERDAELAA